MAESLAIRWDKVWQGSANETPDLWAFLEEAGEASATERLEVVQVDLKHRWKTPAPLKVEDYLKRMPDLARNSDAVLQLAVSEFQARQAAETEVSVDEYTKRFSELGEELRNKLRAAISTFHATAASATEHAAEELHSTETHSMSRSSLNIYIGRAMSGCDC